MTGVEKLAEYLEKQRFFLLSIFDGAQIFSG